VNAFQHRLTLDRLSLASTGIRADRLARGLIIRVGALAESAPVGPFRAIGVAVRFRSDIA
jgi:hypothetical protein